MLTVDIVTNVPTPYNKALFGALSEALDLRVHYQSSELLLPTWAEDDLLDGHDAVIHQGIGLGRYRWWSPRLARAIRRQADIVLVGGSYTSPTVARLLTMRPTPAAYGWWGEQVFANHPYLGRAALSALDRKLDFVLAVGEAAARRFQSLERAPVHVFPYSSAPAAPCPGPSAGHVGYVGQLIERKGVDVLIHALEGIGVELDVVGRGPDEPQLRSLATRLGVEVRWCGPVPNRELCAIRRDWICQAVPSRYDGWGVVVNEALASGTPVVVSDRTGASEMVRDGFNGWLHRAGAVPSLRDALVRAIERGTGTAARRAAALSGREFSSDRAAAFLGEVLADYRNERSFVRERWAVIDAQHRSWEAGTGTG